MSRVTIYSTRHDATVPKRKTYAYLNLGPALLMSTFFYRDGGRVFVSLEETKDRRQDLLGAVPYRPNFLNGDDVGSYPTGDVFKELNRRRDELVSAFIEGRATKDTGLELYAVDRLVSLLRT